MEPCTLVLGTGRVGEAEITSSLFSSLFMATITALALLSLGIGCGSWNGEFLESSSKLCFFCRGFGRGGLGLFPSLVFKGGGGMSGFLCGYVGGGGRSGFCCVDAGYVLLVVPFVIPGVLEYIIKDYIMLHSITSH